MEHFNFESSLFPEENTALKKSPQWTQKCLRNFQRLAEKYGRIWLEIARSIDGRGLNNKQKTKILFQVTENAFQDIMDDMNNLKEKHENCIFRLSEELHGLESKLHLPLSLDVTAPRQELLLAIEKNFRSTVKTKKASESISLIELEEFLRYLVAERTSIEKEKLLRRNNLEDLTETRKIYLVKLWDKCDCGGSIRNNFPLIFTTDYSEDTVDLFDKEIETWIHYYEDNKKILETLQVYRNFQNELIEMETNTDTSKFFKNRGGKLLTELRKLDLLKAKIKKKQAELLNLSKTYLREKGTPFLTFDETIETFIEKGQAKKITKTSTLAKDITKRTIKTPSPLPLYRKITSSKKVTPNLPKFKITGPRNTSPKKKVGWTACRKSLIKQPTDDEEYSDFESDVKKNVPRSSSVLQ